MLFKNIEVHANKKWKQLKVIASRELERGQKGEKGGTSRLVILLQTFSHCLTFKTMYVYYFDFKKKTPITSKGNSKNVWPNSIIACLNFRREEDIHSTYTHEKICRVTI